MLTLDKGWANTRPHCEALVRKMLQTESWGVCCMGETRSESPATFFPATLNKKGDCDSYAEKGLCLSAYLCIYL